MFKKRPKVGPRSERAWSRRTRLMMRQSRLVALAGLLLVAGMIAVSFYLASRPSLLRVAVPSHYAEDVRLMQAIAQQFARDRATIRLRTIVENGPAASAAAVDSGKADLAIVRGDVAIPQQGQAVAILRQNIVTIIVPAAGSPAKAAAPTARSTKARAKAAGKIDKIEDLAGRRIGVVGRGTNNTFVLESVLRQYDIAADKVTVTLIDPDNVGAALRKDPVDVVFVVGPISSRFIADAIAAASAPKTPPTFLAISASEAIASRLPFYETAEIKEGAFGGKTALPADTVETIAFNHYIVARKTVSDSKISDFTRLLFGARQTLARDWPAISRIEKPDTDKDASLQAHPGAAAYIDNEQQTFFDRYSDLLYWGLMAMSFVGSGVAWLTSYAKADDRVRRMRVIERLLAVIKAARSATTLAEIEKLRVEVDEILHRTLHQVEQNDLDESALMAFSLALDQAQLAINDRHATLLANANAEPPAEAGTAQPVETEPTLPLGEVTKLRVAMKTAEG